MRFSARPTVHSEMPSFSSQSAIATWPLTHLTLSQSRPTGQEVYTPVHWLAVAGMVTHANGAAERRASEAMLKAKS